MNMYELLDKVKQNLIISFDDDDKLIESFIAAAISYSEGYQHLESGYYKKHPLSDTTEQAIVMLSSFFYESRDGSTGGMFSNTPAAAEQTWKTVHMLLLMDRQWKV